MSDIKDFKSKLAQLQKKMPDTLFSSDEADKVYKITFDSPQLTYAYCGFSYDRIHHLYGPPSAGKSSICTYIASQLQKKFPERPIVLYVDFEKSFDVKYAEKIGLNCDEDHFVLIRAENVEDAFTVVEELVRTEMVCCVIMDSDATAPTRTENEDEINKANFGGGALAFSRILRRFNTIFSKYKVCCLWISQERANLAYGAKLPSVTGGQAVPFYATTRFRITKLENITGANNEVIGIRLRCRNYKNKSGVPYRDAEMELFFDGGFNSENEYLKFIIDFDFIHKAGGWFTMPSNPDFGKIQGQEKVAIWLKEHPDVFEDLKSKVLNKLLGQNELDANNKEPEFESISKEELEQMNNSTENDVVEIE